MATRKRTGKRSLIAVCTETYLPSDLAGGAADRIQYVATGCASIGLRLLGDGAPGAGDSRSLLTLAL